MAQQPLGPNQERWLQALESGKYEQQTARKLKKQYGDLIAYCCLGVACELFKKEFDLIEEKHENGTFSYNNGHSIVPPRSISEDALALYSSNGKHVTNKELCLTQINDAGKSFDEIATIIRAAPQDWFEEPK